MVEEEEEEEEDEDEEEEEGKENIPPSLGVMMDTK